MNILVLENGALIEKDIKNDLRSLQREIGGLVEIVSSLDDFTQQKIVLLVNEEGKCENNPVPQLVIAHEIYIADILVGKVVFVGYDGSEDFCSLSNEQISFVKSKLNKKIAYKGKMVYVIDQ